MSHLEFFSVHPSNPDGRRDLRDQVAAVHSPFQPGDSPQQPVRMSHWRRLILRAQRHNLPVLGARHHYDAAAQMPMIEAFCGPVLQAALEIRQPEFLFVSPQPNPIALTLRVDGLPTRMVMASYDVEALRMRRIAEAQRGLRRLALSLEAERADDFERCNLARFDAVIAVSQQEKQVFVDRYGFEAERVLVIENGVDPDYFAFTPRSEAEQPTVIFVAALSYLPNRDAAWRLVRRIMPLVRRSIPKARLCLVGTGPETALTAASDGRNLVVTGAVEDVRPWLAQAQVACIPLTSGAGTKYKALEAMSAGVPIVCTYLSAEGLDLEPGRHALVADDDAGLAAAVTRLIREPETAERLAREGRGHVERRFAWQAVLPRLDAWLNIIGELPRRSARRGVRIRPA